MEFTVSKADLVRELNLSQGVVEKKTTIPILSNILVETDGDKVWLTATDLELGIRCSCPARIKKEGAGTIPARRLLDYVRSDDELAGVLAHEISHASHHHMVKLMHEQNKIQNILLPAIAGILIATLTAD